MNFISKKRISLLLSIVMIIASLPLAGITAFAERNGDFSYEALDDETAEITFYYGDAETVNIPAEIDGYTVAYISNDAFDESTAGDATSEDAYVYFDRNVIKKVIIPETVEYIGAGYVFDRLYCLENIEVNIANENYSSQDGVLFNKNKTELLRCPEGKTGAYQIPNSVVSIGEYAFYDCDGLTSITIPNSVTSIGDYAFRYCYSLTEINVDASNKNYSSQDGVLFDKNKTVIIQYPIGNTRASYNIPDSVTSIGDYAFEDCDGLTSVTILNSVTSIGDYAFGGCNNLTSITIPNSVTSIEYGAFYACEKLTDIYILNKECYIDDYDNWTVPSYITIHGYAGSTAQEYANKYGNKFVALEEHPGMEKVPAKAATCTEDGNIEYYHCPDCNKNFKDINGNEEVTDVVVKATGHTLGEKVAAKAATCTEDGNIEYYHCSTCNKNFKDKDGKEEVADVVVKATGHKYENGVCTVCGEKDPNASKPSGEVSGDGKLSTVDAKWILQNIAKSRDFSDEQSKAADLNGDGKLSVVDVKWVLQIVAGMRDAETLELITK